MTQDTIYAPATAAGMSGIAVLRVSGPLAHAALCAVMPGKNFVPRVLTLGKVVDSEGGVLDVCLGVFMPGPRTYTGEDVAELQLHGSPVTMRAVLSTLAKLELLPQCIEGEPRIQQAPLNLRLAQPGEFTRRAFLHGKLDLTQAEAVVDLIHAGGKRAAKAALAQFTGNLSQKIYEHRDALTGLLAQIAAAIDYPDSVDEEAVNAALAQALPPLLASLQVLLDSYQRGRAARDGLRVALLGRPNVGKSTLFNALAGQERAIVTQHPGTTRDVLECSLELAGVRLILCDTAGIRETDQPIERMGVQRAREELRRADLCLLLVEPQPTPEDRALVQAVAVSDTDAANVLLVVNKCDQGAPDGWREYGERVRISAATGWGREALIEALQEKLQALMPQADALVLTNARHYQALQRAHGALARAKDTLSAELPLDLLDIDLRAAWDALGEITGDTATEDILDAVFRDFCLGK